MQKPIAYVSKIKFSDESEFSFERDDKIIIVGPNNSGKSKLLREIMDYAAVATSPPKLVVKYLEMEKIGTIDDFKNFLTSSGPLKNDYYNYFDSQIHNSHVAYWNNQYLNPLASVFIKRIAAEDRLQICHQQSSISPGDLKSTPQHVLYDDDALMKKVSGLFKKSFNKDLFFDFRGGKSLPIHVGKIPKEGELVDRVEDSYVQEVRSNPLLDQQGDGMKSYAGILFHTVVGARDVVLIDEPEAFLHPPQMRRLGETLASEVSEQLWVATHSSDILRGFLDGSQGSLRVLRLRREGDVNVALEARPETIRQLWEKPDLRYSNALEGIFHEQAILCEDDSDCKLFNSISDHLTLIKNLDPLDTAYIPAGGKHAIPAIASVLRDIGVPVKAVFDIDFLSESNLVQSAVKAFGGDWEDISVFWKRVDAAVREGVKPKTNDEIKSLIIDILKANTGENLPKGDIHEALKQGKSWAIVKKFGEAGIPNGNAQRDYATLRSKLEGIGIYIVPVGEVENFCRSIGSHGPKFVTKLLTEIPLSDDRLSEFRVFVKRVQIGAHGRLDSSQLGLPASSNS